MFDVFPYVSRRLLPFLSELPSLRLLSVVGVDIVVSVVCRKLPCCSLRLSFG